MRNRVGDRNCSNRMSQSLNLRLQLCALRRRNIRHRLILRGLRAILLVFLIVLWRSRTRSIRTTVLALYRL